MRNAGVGGAGTRTVGTVEAGVGEARGGTKSVRLVVDDVERGMGCGGSGGTGAVARSEGVLTARGSEEPIGGEDMGDTGSLGEDEGED